MFTTNLSIKSWAEDDRPREKMILKGRKALSDAELLAIILGSGTKTKTAVDLAQEILTTVNYDLFQLGKQSIKDFKKFNGVGDAKAITLSAALELGRRRKDSVRKKLTKMNTSQDVYCYMKPYFEDLEHEEFRIIGLSRSNHVIATELISKGGRTGTIADGKLIFKALLDMKATACILCHNHPSGTLKPSESDLRLTKNFVDFGKLIELPVLDHIIITDNGFFSFSDNQVL